MKVTNVKFKIYLNGCIWYVPGIENQMQDVFGHFIVTYHSYSYYNENIVLFVVHLPCIPIVLHRIMLKLDCKIVGTCMYKE